MLELQSKKLARFYGSPCIFDNGLRACAACELKTRLRSLTHTCVIPVSYLIPVPVPVSCMYVVHKLFCLVCLCYHIMRINMNQEEYYYYC